MRMSRTLPHSVLVVTVALWCGLSRAQHHLENPLCEQGTDYHSCVAATREAARCALIPSPSPQTSVPTLPRPVCAVAASLKCPSTVAQRYYEEPLDLSMGHSHDTEHSEDAPPSAMADYCECAFGWGPALPPGQSDALLSACSVPLGQLQVSLSFPVPRMRPLPEEVSQLKSLIAADLVSGARAYAPLGSVALAQLIANLSAIAAVAVFSESLQAADLNVAWAFLDSSSASALSGESDGSAGTTLPVTLTWIAQVVTGISSICVEGADSNGLDASVATAFVAVRLRTDAEGTPVADSTPAAKAAVRNAMSDALAITLMRMETPLAPEVAASLVELVAQGHPVRCGEAFATTSRRASASFDSRYYYFLTLLVPLIGTFVMLYCCCCEARYPRWSRPSNGRSFGGTFRYEGSGRGDPSQKDNFLVLGQDEDSVGFSKNNSPTLLPYMMESLPGQILDPLDAPTQLRVSLAAIGGARSEQVIGITYYSDIETGEQVEELKDYLTGSSVPLLDFSRSPSKVVTRPLMHSTSLVASLASIAQSSSMGLDKRPIFEFLAATNKDFSVRKVDPRKVAAAILIQKICRGRLSRELVRSLRNRKAANVLGDAWAGRLKIKDAKAIAAERRKFIELEDLRNTKYAQTLQAYISAQKSDRLVSAKRQESSVQQSRRLQQINSEHGASLVIQSAWKMYKARSLCAAKRVIWASIVLQRAWRNRAVFQELHVPLHIIAQQRQLANSEALRRSHLELQESQERTFIRDDFIAMLSFLDQEVSFSVQVHTMLQTAFSNGSPKPLPEISSLPAESNNITNDRSGESMLDSPVISSFLRSSTGAYTQRLPTIPSSSPFSPTVATIERYPPNTPSQHRSMDLPSQRLYGNTPPLSLSIGETSPPHRSPHPHKALTYDFIVDAPLGPVHTVRVSEDTDLQRLFRSLLDTIIVDEAEGRAKVLKRELSERRHIDRVQQTVSVVLAHWRSG